MNIAGFVRMSVREKLESIKVIKINIMDVSREKAKKEIIKASKQHRSSVYLSYFYGNDNRLQ